MQQNELSLTHQQAIVSATAAYVDQAETALNVKLPDYRVLFNLRGKAAGQCRLQHGRWDIRYNKAIFARYLEDNITNTIPHEVAHFVVFNTNRTRVPPHGREWQAIMQLFDAEATVTHRYDVSDLSTRQYQRFSYRCQCQEHQLTSIRHRRILAGQQYRCRFCGSALRYQASA